MKNNFRTGEFENDVVTIPAGSRKEFVINNPRSCALRSSPDDRGVNAIEGVLVNTSNENDTYVFDLDIRNICNGDDLLQFNGAKKIRIIFEY